MPGTSEGHGDLARAYLGAETKVEKKVIRAGPWMPALKGKALVGHLRGVMGELLPIEHELKVGITHPHPPVGGFHPTRELLSLRNVTASHIKKPY